MTRSRKRKLARNRAKWAGMPLASALIAGGGVSHAADPTDTTVLDEVVVTAQKRSEDLQKVPISLQVLNGAQLEQHQVTDFDDFAKLLPSVSFQSFGPGQSQIYFRGIASGQDGLHAGSLPGTGVYLDEIPVTTIGNTLVGGNYVLTATNEAISQAAGTSLQVVGNVTVTGASIVLNGSGNLIGGTTTLPASNTTELPAAGVITLGLGMPGNTAYSGNLTVVSEATNRSFGINLALLREANDMARQLNRGTVGRNVMYFETGQGSSLSANANHGVDQQTCEARAYAVARAFSPMLVNTVVGFIGPECLYNGKQIRRAALEDHFCGKLLGLPMGCDICYTNHAEADDDDMDAVLTMLAAAGVNYIMGVPGADDIMLNYQSTSFHDALFLRRVFNLRPAPEFEAWYNTRKPELLDAMKLLEA